MIDPFIHVDSGGLEARRIESVAELLFRNPVDLLGKSSCVLRIDRVRAAGENHIPKPKSGVPADQMPMVSSVANSKCNKTGDREVGRRTG